MFWSKQQQFSITKREDLSIDRELWSLEGALKDHSSSTLWKVRWLLLFSCSINTGLLQSRQNLGLHQVNNFAQIWATHLSLFKIIHFTSNSYLVTDNHSRKWIVHSVFSLQINSKPYQFVLIILHFSATVRKLLQHFKLYQHYSISKVVEKMYSNRLSFNLWLKLYRGYFLNELTGAQPTFNANVPKLCHHQLLLVPHHLKGSCTEPRNISKSAVTGWQSKRDDWIGIG